MRTEILEGMKLLNEFKITLAKLELGQHDLSYKINDEFFELFDYSLVKHGQLNAEVDLVKKVEMITLSFEIKGSVQLTCDRSLEAYDHELDTDGRIILKFGEEAEVLSDEMEIMPSNTQEINLATYIYEFITVAIPMKKLHPKYKDDPADDQMIYSSENEGGEEETGIDPRWNKLKKLKNKS